MPNFARGKGNHVIGVEREMYGHSKSLGLENMKNSSNHVQSKKPEKNRQNGKGNQVIGVGRKMTPRIRKSKRFIKLHVGKET